MVIASERDALRRVRQTHTFISSTKVIYFRHSNPDWSISAFLFYFARSPTTSSAVPSAILYVALIHFYVVVAVIIIYCVIHLRLCHCGNAMIVCIIDWHKYLATTMLLCGAHSSLNIAHIHTIHLCIDYLVQPVKVHKAVSWDEIHCGERARAAQRYTQRENMRWGK